MNPRTTARAVARLLALLLALMATACSSPPSELYLLNATAAARQSPAAPPLGGTEARYGSTLPPDAGGPTAGPLVAVAVTVPEYLDRLDLVERTSPNELRPVYSAQWGENLAVTATRVVAENLTALAPADDIIALPSRSAQNFDYRVDLNLTRFESDTQGTSTLAGRWSISDRDGRERARGRVQRTEQAAQAIITAAAAVRLPPSSRSRAT